MQIDSKRLKELKALNNKLGNVIKKSKTNRKRLEKEINELCK